MYCRIFSHADEGFYASARNYDCEATIRDALGVTLIFSSIGDALSKAYSSTKDTVSEAAEKVAETVSDASNVVANAYEATRTVVVDTAEKVTDVVTEAASSAYDSTSETLSQAAGSVSESVSSAYDSTSKYVGDVISGEEKLNYATVIGGAVIGVGAVAAAPFTGGGSLLGAAGLLSSLAGATTVAAAVSVGVAGAVVGAHLGDDSAAREEGRIKGQQEAKAEHALQIEKLNTKLAQARDALESTATHANAVIALFAVAIAAANCDGPVNALELQHIDMFVTGMSGNVLPKDVQQRIAQIYDTPLPLRDAYAMAVKSGVPMSDFDELIAVLLAADDSTDTRKDAFKQAWNTLKAA